MITIDKDIKLDYKDVLLVPKFSDLENPPNSRAEADTIGYYSFLEPNKYFGVTPIIAANMDHVGTFNMARELAEFHIMTALVKHYKVEELVNFYEKELLALYAIYSMGIGDEDWGKFVAFNDSLESANIAKPLIVCVDVANAYTEKFLNRIKEIKKHYPNYVIMGGNVVTADGVDQLTKAGVNIVKVGIGPGSACSTRRETGVGYPQFSAVLECARAASAIGGMICADGGIECPGDVAKAIAAGAGFVMIGGQFAGHVEGYPTWVYENTDNKDTVPFYGMASKEAQNKHNGGLKEYRSSEGKEFKIPKRGLIKNTAQHYLGGLRSACLYQGVRNVLDLSRDAHFVRVSRQMNEVFHAHQR